MLNVECKYFYILTEIKGSVFCIFYNLNSVGSLKACANFNATFCQNFEAIDKNFQRS